MKQVTDLGTIHRKTFEPTSEAIKHAQVALAWVPKGALSNTAPTFVDVAAPVLVYNPTATVIFVGFGDAAMAAISGATNGIPVLAGQTQLLNSGAFQYVRASAAGAFYYVNS